LGLRRRAGLLKPRETLDDAIAISDERRHRRFNSLILLAFFRAISVRPDTVSAERAFWNRFHDDLDLKPIPPFHGTRARPTAF
jgi:hypothetical protein